ncbi:MAG: hypothetical protein O2917_09635 [Acidobacteria bacterium]|nr:hypothetical protein [Acidobacteriota bacterium]
MADLFSGERRGALRPSIVAEYDYIDRDGVLVAQKLRYSNKTFRWRRPGRQAGAWSWRLDGATPGLYRLPELIDSQQVFLNEGEKSVDLLWSLGLPATCPPSGASSWLPSWSRDLWEVGCGELVILADNDSPGSHFAERVAEITSQAHSGGGEPIAVKILRLPGLEKGADAFDWLQGGHTPQDLLDAAADAPVWLPGASERERVERTRASARVRQQRLRARRRMEVIGHAVNEGRRRVA